MSTRCNVIIKDESTTLYFYRHSDGYPDCAGESLKEFVKGYKSKAMRSNASQSAGWLIMQGNTEYEHPNKPGVKNSDNSFDSWKVGAYEPTDNLHSDVEYIYIIDLVKMELTCRVPTAKFWDKTTLSNTKILKEFKVSFEYRDALEIHNAQNPLSVVSDP